MSDSTRATSAGYGPINTLAVRLSEDVRAQLDIIAQVNDRTVTDEIRLSPSWSTEIWPNTTRLQDGTVRVTAALTTDWGATSSAEADFEVRGQ